MRKGVFALTFILLAVIGFASAQGLSELLSSMDTSTVIFAALFIISFALLFYALSWAFKGNTAIAGSIAAAASFLLVFWINKAGVSFDVVFYDIGISEELVAAVLPFIIIGGIILIIVKLKRNSWFVFGGILCVAAPFIYQKLIAGVFGIIFLFIGLLLALKKKPKGFFISQK